MQRRVIRKTPGRPIDGANEPICNEFIKRRVLRTAQSQTVLRGSCDDAGIMHQSNLWSRKYRFLSTGFIVMVTQCGSRLASEFRLEFPISVLDSEFFPVALIYYCKAIARLLFQINSRFRACVISILNLQIPPIFYENLYDTNVPILFFFFLLYLSLHWQFASFSQS